jgi:hypothetical protein
MFLPPRGGMWLDNSLRGRLIVFATSSRKRATAWLAFSTNMSMSEKRRDSLSQLLSVVRIP